MNSSGGSSSLPEWLRLQEQAELLAARFSGIEQTASHGGVGTDAIWKERVERVKQELLNTIGRRDALAI